MARRIMRLHDVRLGSTRCLLRKTSNWCAGWLGRLSAGTTSRCSTRSQPESSRKRPNAGSSRFRARSRTSRWRSPISSPKATRWSRTSDVRARIEANGSASPPTGRRFERINEIYIFEVRGGKLISALGVEDNLTRMRQLGINLRNPKPSTSRSSEESSRPAHSNAARPRVTEARRGLDVTAAKDEQQLWGGTTPCWGSGRLQCRWTTARPPGS